MNKNTVLQLDPTSENERNSEGSFITLQDGRILYAWTKFGKSHDNEPSVLVSLTSADGGQSWSDETRVLITPEGGAAGAFRNSCSQLGK